MGCDCYDTIVFCYVIFDAVFLLYSVKILSNWDLGVFGNLKGCQMVIIVKIDHRDGEPIGHIGPFNTYGEAKKYASDKNIWPYKIQNLDKP